MHAADVEGRQQGIDAALVRRLAAWCSTNDNDDNNADNNDHNDNHNDNSADDNDDNDKDETFLPVTYAGGATGVADLRRVARLSAGRVDLTIGSALDIFGGRHARFADCVRWNRRQKAKA